MKYYLSIAIEKIFRKPQLSTVVVTTLGIILGLVIGALVSVPVGKLNWEYASLLSVVLTIGSVGILGLAFFYQKESLIDAFNTYWPLNSKYISRKTTKTKKRRYKVPKLFLDSSVIIDGRILDILQTGFIAGELVLVDAILDEIKKIADSKDGLRKKRGRRGLEILEEMRKEEHLPFRFIQIDKLEGVKGLAVDERLVFAAKKYHGKVLTTDYNLHKRASIMGVEVLNINELANMVKTNLLPGESCDLVIAHEGKVKGQGVGYLPDGTLVIVEHGEGDIGNKVSVEITRLLQTDAGKILFGKQTQDLTRS